MPRIPRAPTREEDDQEHGITCEGKQGDGQRDGLQPAIMWDERGGDFHMHCTQPRRSMTEPSRMSANRALAAAGTNTARHEE
jgi:hypothetical protein